MNTSNRRDFMKGSLLATAAVAASTITGTTGSAIAAGDRAVPVSARLKTGATKAAGDPPMRLSVLSYSFRGLMGEGKMDVFGYFEACKYRYNLSIADIWNGFLTSMEEGYPRQLYEHAMRLLDPRVGPATVNDY